MRKPIYALLVLALISVVGCGGGPGPRADGRGGPQDGKRPGPPPAMSQAGRLDKLIAELTKMLDLTPDQAAKVKAIVKEGEEVKAKLEPSDEELKSREGMEMFFDKLIMADKETEKKLATVLSAGQLNDYKDYMKEYRRRGLGKQGGSGGGGPGKGAPPRRGRR